MYPEPSSTTKSTTGSKLGKQRSLAHESGSSSGEYEDEDANTADLPVEGGPEVGKKHASAQGGRPAAQRESRQSSNQSRSMAGSSSQAKEKSLSPSTDDASSISKSRSTSASLPGMLSSVSTNTSQETRAWSHLPQDLRYYLDYYQNHVTHHHYFFKHDASNFVHSILLEIAPSYEPLLYAVVGFAAFQATLKRPNGQIQDFLKYYNKSVSLLRKSLQAHQRHTDATMLTILQLAAFEVCILIRACSAVNASLLAPGISWRLGKFIRPPKSCVRDAVGIILSGDHYGYRSPEEDPCLVCTI